MITEAVRREMNPGTAGASVYRHLLEMMATQTTPGGTHKLITTNWDFLLQRELDRWIMLNKPGYAPRFLGAHGMVYHLNGSVEPGDFQNRSPFLLETDPPDMRTRTYEANQAFNYLLWSSLVVIVGMSFECDIDRGLLAALRHHENNVPIGGAHFVVVEPNANVLASTMNKLASCFRRGSGAPVNLTFDDWTASGMPELRHEIFSAQI